MRPNWNKHQGKESLSLVNLRHNHSRTLFLTPMKALHRCLHLSPSLLEKKKSLQSLTVVRWLRFSPSFSCRLSLLYNTPCLCLCTAPGLHIPTRGLSNGSPLIFLSCPPPLSLLTSLHCSSSQLSFPAVCLSTASPSSLPSLTFVCQPPCL